MGKFGKKNHVNLDILSYNTLLLGESKCGKTTLIKEVCEKLSGDDGYLFLEIGSERGADAIENISYINCPSWEEDYNEFTNSAGFIDVCEDIIENKTTDYPNLKVVVWDTYDQLITLAEEESIRLWNKECRATGHADKCTKSINSAWGGFGKGEKKAIALMIDTMTRLRQVGVATIIIGHVKVKDINDVVTGETYQILTSDQQQNYFNAIKKNLHFMGLAYIDRTIVKEKTGKKNIVTKKDEVKGKVKEETRRIKFRDDSYAVDSGSRFADIVPEIEMTADAFIEALTNAIKSEQQKSGTSYTDAKKEQEKKEQENEQRIAEAEKNRKAKGALKDVINEIISFFAANKSDINTVKPVLEFIRKHGYENPTEIDDIDFAKEVVEFIKS